MPNPFVFLTQWYHWCRDIWNIDEMRQYLPPQWQLMTSITPVTAKTRGYRLNSNDLGGGIKIIIFQAFNHGQFLCQNYQRKYWSFIWKSCIRACIVQILIISRKYIDWWTTYVKEDDVKTSDNCFLRKVLIFFCLHCGEFRKFL